MATNDLQSLLESFYQIADKNNWHQHHSPKNLAMAISVEAAELMNVLQWHHSDEKLGENDIDKLSDEIADVFLYLLCLADKLDLNLIDIAKAKMAANLQR